MTGPALYDCRLRHVRGDPIGNDFTYGTYQWLVDLDELPQLPWPMRPLAGFRAADHLGDPERRIRDNVDRYLAGHGIDLRGGRVLMLSNARVLGHVFNPLTVYWCHDDIGEPVCVIAEVHNTYGQSHCYLLRPDEYGTATTAKDFYVSPFYAASGGTYQMRLPEPGHRLSLSIRLEQPGRAPFVASLHGARRPGTAANLLRMALRHPLPTLTVSARIRWQGIRLFLRGLPVEPRPRPDSGGSCPHPAGARPVAPAPPRPADMPAPLLSPAGKDGRP